MYMKLFLSSSCKVVWFQVTLFFIMIWSFLFIFEMLDTQNQAFVIITVVHINVTTPFYGFGYSWTHSKLGYIDFTNKDSKVFIPLSIKIEYTWDKFKWKFSIVQIKIIHVLVVMIFHMCKLLCINTLIHNHKCKKCLNKLI